MKELSIEEKAKAYDEALARANEMIKAMTNIGGVAKVDDIQHIFPELKESEDERIRKEIRDFICWATDRGSITREQLEKSNSWLAWLEKQGEQKPAIKFKIGDIIKCGLSTLKVANINYNKNFYELKTKEGIVVTCISFAEQDKWELVEQNPAEDRYMEGYLNGVNDISKTLKPAVWSEEDERISSNINLYIRKAGDYPHFGKENIKEAKNWMNALKDRIQPHPKQEWSEEDIEILESCISLMSYNDAAKEETDWLKSLRPQSQWKPSESDIRILEQVIGGTVNPINYHATLYAILEQLKKL